MPLLRRRPSYRVLIGDQPPCTVDSFAAARTLVASWATALLAVDTCAAPGVQALNIALTLGGAETALHATGRWSSSVPQTSGPDIPVTITYTR